MTTAHARDTTKSFACSLHKHPTLGFWVDPEFGAVLGRMRNRGRIAYNPVGSLSPDGYVHCSFKSSAGKVTSTGAGKIVFEAIFGLVPDGYHVHHLNFDRADNRIENLKAIPAEENRSCRAKKLTPMQVKQILDKQAISSDKETATEMGLSVSIVQGVRSGKRYKHLM